MSIDLSYFDIDDERPATLTDMLTNEDLCESQDCFISVQYNQIDLGATKYGFDQPFEGKESLLYFKRMKEFASQSINEIIESKDYKLHFYRTDVRGNIKKIFDSIDKSIAKANPLIYHFALDPDCKVANANREENKRNPRIYFMVGHSGQIHILFFDPYHEINP